MGRLAIGEHTECEYRVGRRDVVDAVAEVVVPPLGDPHADRTDGRGCQPRVGDREYPEFAATPEVWLKRVLSRNLVTNAPLDRRRPLLLVVCHTNN